MTDEQREDYEERAAILEYEAGMPRKQAEALAKSLIFKSNQKKFEKNEKNALHGQGIAF